jgi:hypothetical protein
MISWPTNRHYWTNTIWSRFIIIIWNCLSLWKIELHLDKEYLKLILTIIFPNAPITTAGGTRRGTAYVPPLFDNVKVPPVRSKFDNFSFFANSSRRLSWFSIWRIDNCWTFLIFGRTKPLLVLIGIVILWEVLNYYDEKIQFFVFWKFYFINNCFTFWIDMRIQNRIIK